MTGTALTQLMAADHDALNALMRGDPEPKKQLFSRRHDATLASPLAPPAQGWAQIEATLERAAQVLAGSEPLRFHRISAVITADLAYIVEIEQSRGPLGDTTGALHPFALRATTVFRREEDRGWRICHRHADPITTPRPVDSLITPPEA